MFGKLCKYEWKYLLRFFLPMWGGVLVLSIINHFSFPMMVNGGGSDSREIAGALLFMALVIAVCAVCVVSLVVIIQRFYHGLLKDEGYLMFTLPVKSGALINAKGLMAVVMMVLTGVVCVAVVFIVATRGVTWNDVSEFFYWMFVEAGWSGLDWTMVILWLVVLCVTSTAEEIYRIYMAMAIGHTAKKHRVGWSVVAYLGVVMVQSALANIITFNTNWFNFWTRASDLLSGLSVAQEIVVGELILSVGYALLTLLFFFVTRQILEKRLNLE